MNFLKGYDKNKPPLPRPKPPLPPSKPQNVSVPQTKAASWSEPLKVSETTIRNVQALKLSMEQVRSENRELRQMRDEALRQARNDISLAWQQKMENMRQKWHRDKEKSLAANSAQLSRHFEQKIETICKLNDKEIHSLQLQLRRSQERLMSVSRSGGLESVQSQESLRSTSAKSAKSTCRAPVSAPAPSNCLLSVPSMFRRHSLSPMKLVPRPKSPNYASDREDNRSISQSITEESRLESVSDVELDVRLREERSKFDAELRQVRRAAQHHVKNLLEELKVKERQIERFEHSLAAIEQRQLSKEEDRTEDKDEMMSACSSKINSTHKFMGGVQMMSKDEHEREKQRWQLKVVDLEQQLRKSDESLSDLNVTKAELNKRIVELERNQKPLSDNNRRFAERNKILMTDNKKFEERVRHLQEDLLVLKDTHERLLVENNRMKEKRISPEKMDELEEYKQQNLDYCRCITVLKQSTIEKDRKIDLLQKKLRTIRRSRNSVNDAADFDDNRSCAGCSEFSTSSISLDTITEDFEEVPKEDLESNYKHLTREHLELQRAYSSLRASASAINLVESELSLDRQRHLEHKLRLANDKISDLEKSIATNNALGMDSSWAQEKLAYCSRMKAVQTKVEELLVDKDKMNKELDEVKEEKELLEFQMLEMEQNTEDCSISGDISVRSLASSTCDQAVSTSDDDGFASSIDSILQENNFASLPLDELKIRFTLLKHRRELRREDRMVVAQVKQWLEDLQTQNDQCTNKEMQQEMMHREKEVALKTQIVQLEDKNVKLEDEFQIQADDMRKQLKSLEEYSASVKDKLAARTDQYETSKLEVGKLKEKLRMIEESSAKDRIEVESLRKKMSELGQSRVEEINIMDRRDKNYSEEVHSLRQQMSDCQNARDRLLIEKERLKEEKHNLSKALATRPSDCDMSHIQNRLKDCEELLNLKMKENKELNENEIKFRNEIELKTTENSEMQLRFDKQLTVLKNQLDVKNNELKNIEELQTQLKAACDSMQKQLAEYKYESSCGKSKEHGRDGLETEIKTLNQKLIKIKDEAERNSVLAERQRTELDKWTVENQKMRERLVELETVNEKWKQTQAQLVETDKLYKEAKTRFRDSIKIIKEYESMDKQYDTKLKEANEKAFSLQEELKKVRVLQLKSDLGQSKSADANKMKEMEKVAKEQADKIVVYKKELNHAKNYQKQLEQQFQLQLEMVNALKQQITCKPSVNNTEGGNKDLSLLLRLVSPLITHVSRGNNPNPNGDNWEEKATRMERNLSEMSLNEATSPDDIRKLTHIIAHILRICGKQQIETVNLERELKSTKSETDMLEEKVEQISRQYQETRSKLNSVDKKYIGCGKSIEAEVAWLKPHDDIFNRTPLNVTVDTVHPSIIQRLVQQLKGAVSETRNNTPANNCIMDAVHDLEQHLTRFNLLQNCDVARIDECESPDHGSNGVSPNDDGRSNSSASGPSHEGVTQTEVHSSLSSAGDEDESSMSDGVDSNLGMASVSSISNHEMWRKMNGKQKRFRGFRRSSPYNSDVRCIAPKPCNLLYNIDPSTNCICSVHWDLPMCVDTVLGYKLYINGEVAGTVRDRSQNSIRLARPVSVSPFVRIYMTSIGAEGKESEPAFAVPHTKKFSLNRGFNNCKTSISLEQNFGTSEV